MKQSIFCSSFFHPVKKVLSFIAHSVSVAVMGAGLFLFGFYVIPVFGDTSQQLYASFNKPVVSASVIKQDLKHLHQAPSEPSCTANCGDDFYLGKYLANLK